MRRLLTAALVAGSLTACGTGSAAGDAVPVVIGYQSKTINTVTAGTLLRERGFFEQRLRELGRRTGKRYEVTWQDYDTGAPITAQMIAGKVDIGSMGDFPLLINGSRTQGQGDEGTRMVSVTGYNARGALNMVVVRPDSTARTLADLKGQRVSASVGSAGHGTLVRALGGVEVTVENQQPSVGASALQGGGVAALSQFVAWPGQLVFDKQAKLLYDGAALDFPTLHGVVVRKPFATARPDVLAEFLRAQLDATRYLHANPLAAAESVAAATGLRPEVVYLYNGPNGIATFDLSLKSVLRRALKDDVPFLKSIGNIEELDVDRFVDDGPLRATGFETTEELTNPARITGTDSACGVEVSDSAAAGEVWFEGETATRPAATPDCLLKQVKQAGKKVRAAYVPDAATGTRWFAEHAHWVRVNGGLLPFTTEAAAAARGAVLTYEQALAGA
ncbi:ABC transporter substrate-binding protein [Actinosynnema sp. NPDC047251]|uniref:ABC-type transporter, substrate-binding lipoprotein n=1 Tax=Saccharothrix espanaensis (strain ATCC 51144 / DSM 44229 / JCM 9112 / NBRC 15066 / NRRL 15764) TaxID=1179773 RepID=K0JSB6_SACES|nr:ABC transporter substrate-binding protein [Saccharothrix espanaensis]CCH27724.1 ABC-type transporter, substrate-binding lipoprotein [Saccharothrix espanaensis DSM 44229]